MEREARERILNVLRPYAANWSGSLGRGDLVIPQREIPRLVRDIFEAVQDTVDVGQEATEAEFFHALADARRLGSLQDQVERLRNSFRILKR